MQRQTKDNIFFSSDLVFLQGTIVSFLALRETHDFHLGDTAVA